MIKQVGAYKINSLPPPPPRPLELVGMTSIDCALFLDIAQVGGEGRTNPSMCIVPQNKALWQIYCPELYRFLGTP